MLQWLSLNETLAWWLVVSSAFTFIASLVSVPWLVIRLPSDHFSVRRRRNQRPAVRHPLVRLSLKTLRNLAGLTLLLAGVLMLVLPGQGLLAIVAGLMLMSFPGKRRLVRRIVSRPWILGPMNNVRRRAGRAPLSLQQAPEEQLSAEKQQSSEGLRAPDGQPTPEGHQETRS